MFQIEKVSGFELSVLYSYPMKSAFVFVSGLKYDKNNIRIRFYPYPIRIHPTSMPPIVSCAQAALACSNARIQEEATHGRSIAGSGANRAGSNASQRIIAAAAAHGQAQSATRKHESE